AVQISHGSIPQLLNSPPGSNSRPFHNLNLTSRAPFQRRSVQPHELTPPPHSSGTFLRHGSEPVLPQHGANLVWRRLTKRISGKKCEHVLFIFEQPNFGVRHERVIAPRSKRSKPQIPIEARLIRRVNSWWTIQRLGLIAKRIGNPSLPIVRTLELNFETPTRHDRKQAVAVGNPEWLEGTHGSRGQGHFREHPDHLRRSCIPDPSHKQRSDSELRTLPPPRDTFPNWRISPHTLLRTQRSPQSAGPALRYDVQHKTIIQQQYPQGEHKVVQERIVRSQDHPNLPGSHNEETNNPPPARKEQHPH